MPYSYFVSYPYDTVITKEISKGSTKVTLCVCVCTKDSPQRGRARGHRSKSPRVIFQSSTHQICQKISTEQQVGSMMNDSLTRQTFNCMEVHLVTLDRYDVLMARWNAVTVRHRLTWTKSYLQYRIDWLLGACTYV